MAVNERTNAIPIISRIPALLHSINDIEKAGDFTEEVNRILNLQIPAQKNPLSPEFVSMIDELHSKVILMTDLSIDYLEERKPLYTFKIIELEGRINEMHYSLREKILHMIQEAQCDPVGGLNTIDFLDEMEMIADKLKNLVKAGTHDFTYNYDNNEDQQDTKELGTN